MRKIIVARHGYAPMEGLTNRGREQVAELAKGLHTEVVGSVAILASSSRRGTESAEILAEALQCPVTFHEILWKDNYHGGGSFEDIKKLVEKYMEGIDTVIIVGHQDHGGNLLKYLGEKIFQVPVAVSGAISYGQAYILDLDSKTNKIV